MIIVDERLAERFWPNEDPIGRRMYQPRSAETLMQVDENTRWLTVVGVVRSIRLSDLSGSGSSVGAYFFPYAQSPEGGITLAVKTRGAPQSLATAVRNEMARVDPEVALFDVKTMQERADLSLSSKRTAMFLAVGFGIVALLLSALGIYGVLAYSVSQRRREIGIRVALGSTTAKVMGLVAWEGFVLALVGLALGAAGAVALRGVMASEIYGVGALDPMVLGGVALLLVGVAGTAALIPARRASRIDPARALRA
ncbi:MAG: FtsX-like permease family protein [Bryobacterales bacterium]